MKAQGAEGNPKVIYRDNKTFLSVREKHILLSPWGPVNVPKLRHGVEGNHKDLSFALLRQRRECHPLELRHNEGMVDIPHVNDRPELILGIWFGNHPKRADHNKPFSAVSDDPSL